MYEGFLKVCAVSNKIYLGNPKLNALEIINNVNDNLDADIILFPELSLTGYSCSDTFFASEMTKQVSNALNYILDNNKFNGILVFGAPLRLEGSLVNAAIAIKKNEILGVVPKYYLPNDNEYYEKRWFISGFDSHKEFIYLNNKKVPFGNLIFSDNKHDLHLGIEICEDMWSMLPPSGMLSLNGCNVILNLSASNAYLNKKELRKCAVIDNSRRNNVAYIYASCNASDSTSETVFSSHIIMASTGELCVDNDEISVDTKVVRADIDLAAVNYKRAKASSLHVSIAKGDIYQEIDFNLEEREAKLENKFNKLPFVPKDLKGFYEIKDILEISLYKRLSHLNMKHVILGVSGGLDSTLALLVCYNTFKRLNLDVKNIIAVTMPGFGTSNRTKDNATKMMEDLGVTVLTKDITESSLLHFKLIDHDRNKLDITYENTQARIRTLILMNLANMYNGIVIGTGDMSELALGWCTYNGDQMSMYSLNAGIPKTLVKYLIKAYADIEFIDLKEVLYDVLDTPISPELLGTNQKTEDNIGKYEINDFILYRYLNYGDSLSRLTYLLCDTFDMSLDNAKEYLDKFFKRFFSQQFKRQATPDGPKVLNVSLNPRSDLRMPCDMHIWSKYE